MNHPQACLRRLVDEKDGAHCGKPARFIVYGKLMPPDFLGPRCEDCAHDQLDPWSSHWRSRIEEYAIYEIPAAGFARRIAERYGYTLPDLQGLGRQADRVAVRSLAACLLREAGFSLPIIARALRRNHSTVMHSLRKVSDAYDAGVETALPELPQRPEAEPTK